MEFEGERFDQGAVELGRRDNGVMAEFSERKRQTKIGVDVAVRPPTRDEDARVPYRAEAEVVTAFLLTTFACRNASIALQARSI